jgi:hypothetical protein
MGEVVELLRVVFEESAPEAHLGDVVVHEYGSYDNGKFLSQALHPLYKNSRKHANEPATPFPKGKQPPAAHFKPLLCTVWTEAIAMFGDDGDILTKKGRLINKQTKIELLK